MLLHHNNRKKNRLWLYGFMGRFVPRVRRRVFFSIFLLVFYGASIVATAILAQWLYRYGNHGPHEWGVQIKQAAMRTIHFPRYLRALNADIPRLDINIKFKNLQLLTSHRQNAMARGNLINSDHDPVSADIVYEGKTYPVKARLKGDALDHISSEKWSLRVKVRDDQSIRGMAEFSLQAPQTRGDAYYPFYAFAMKREGIIAPRTEMVRVFLNGEEKGVYNIEEEIRKEIMEVCQRREGVIVAFQEDLMWVNLEESFMRHDSPFNNWQHAEVRLMGEKRVRTIPSLSKQADVAIALLEGFRSGKLKASEVFDVELLARYLALSSLLGGGHATLWENIRFYYNPITLRLEPIARDAQELGGTSVIHNLLCDAGSYYMEGPINPETGATTLHQSLGTLHRAWFSDHLVLQKYVIELQRVGSPEYLEKLLKDAGPVNETSITALRREKAGETFDSSFLYKNQKTIRNILHPAACVQAHAQTSPTGVNISVANLLALPVRVLGFNVNGTPFEVPKAAPLLLEGRKNSTPIQYQGYSLQIPAATMTNRSPVAVEVFHEIPGNGEVRTQPAPLQTTVEITSEMRHAPSIQEALARHPFLTGATNTHVFQIRAGKWDVQGDLITPQGICLVAGPGTTLRFESNAYFCANGPLVFKGTVDHPVVLTSQQDRWEGVLVLESPQPSSWEHVVAEKARFPSRPGMGLTGAVTFYKSDATLTGCTFGNNWGEDALNSFSCHLKMVDCLFTNTFGDAFDSDFSDVQVRNCRFIKLGDDSMDVSTTKLDVEGVYVFQGRDKGISGGEGSTVNVRNSHIEGMKSGLVAKDGSTVTASGINLVSNQVGCAVYSHKVYWGGGTMDARNIEFTGCGQNLQVEVGSHMTVNDVLQPANETNVWTGFQSVGKKAKK